jgi:hypothetical protein
MFTFSFIVLFILIAGLYVAEARHDRDIERVQKTSDNKLIEAWHKSDSIFHVFLNLMVSFLAFVFVPVVVLGLPAMWWSGVVFGIMLLGFRQIFMVIPLNLMRNRKPLYIGSTAKFDKYVEKFGWLVFLIAGLIIIGGMLFFLL